MKTKNIKIAFVGILWILTSAVFGYAFFSNQEKDFSKIALQIQKTINDNNEMFYSTENYVYNDNYMEYRTFDTTVRNQYLRISKLDKQNNFDWKNAMPVYVDRYGYFTSQDSIIKFWKAELDNQTQNTKAIHSTWQHLLFYRILKIRASENFYCMPFREKLYLIELNDSTLAINHKQHTSQVDVVFEGMYEELQERHSFTESSIYLDRRNFRNEKYPLKMRVDYFVGHDTISVRKNYLFFAAPNKKHYEFEEVEIKKK